MTSILNDVTIDLCFHEPERKLRVGKVSVELRVEKKGEQDLLWRDARKKKYRPYVKM